MKKIKFSLVIPIYNIESYLGKCLETIYKQAYDNYEVIMVDDGSKDSSHNICKEYEKKSKKFHYYYKENGGLSSARNFGLSKVTGDYIWFIDGDDYISINALANFYKLISKKNADIIFFKHYDDVESNIKSPNERYYNLYGTDRILCPVSAWSKIFKKDFFIENNFKFIEGRIYEDLELIPFVISCSNKIAFSEEYEYYYVQRRGSIMNQNKQFNPNRDDKFIAIDSLISKFKNNKTYDSYYEEIEYLAIRHLLLMYSSEILIFSRDIYYNRCKKSLDYISKMNKKWYKNKYLKDSSIFSRFYIVLFRKKLFYICKILLFIRDGLKWLKA